MTSPKPQHPNASTVVIGASMAGLLAARILADHFRTVTIVERDLLPAAAANRKGVPQGRHVHVLLERGRQAMERHLPGLTDDLTRLGACNVEDAGTRVAWFHSGFHKPGPSGIPAVGVSRPTLEAAVRNRVLALPNVRVMDACSVSGLTTSADHARVTGVRLSHARDDAMEESLPADLVVDAGGRGSRTPAWLDALGFRPPSEEEVEIGVEYATCFYRRTPEHLPGLDGVIFLATPSRKRIGVLLPQDGDRWVATMGGYLGTRAPADYEQFRAFARNLPASLISDVIEHAERLTEPVTYKFRSNLRRHYERLRRFPEGYVVIGDALCSFNPVYGQGMTVAALEADALARCLARGRARLARRFFRTAARIIDVPWSSAVGNDLGFPEVKGRRTPVTHAINWYVGKMHAAARRDAQVSCAFLKVINMVAPPPSILHPRVIWRTAKASFGGAPAAG